MDAAAVPFKLRERLGPEATGGLLHVLEVAQSGWNEDVLTLAGERFERRLAEGHSALQVQLVQSEAALHSDIGQVEVRLRQEVGQVEVRLRQEMSQLEVRLREALGDVGGGLRRDLSEMEVRIIREIGTSRFDLIKWTFAFWIGQVVAMSAIMAAMLRAVR